MVSELMQILETHVEDPQIGALISEAIDFLALSKLTREHPFTDPAQPSKGIAQIHAFRKRSGYYDKASIVGLDTTIEALANADTLVRLGVIETDRGAVAVWLDAQKTPLGILILKGASPNSLP